MAGDEVARTFRALVEGADRKFARVRDVPPYGRSWPSHYYQKVFKAYTRLWKYQQENRARLVEAGLQRWEIGEIASRIGQLYFGQYTRTSEARFLFESYIFYEAILSRGYFEGSKKGSARDLGLRFKELRFFARFLQVAMLLSRFEMVNVLVERFRALVEDSRATFRETNFKEWKLVAQESTRFVKFDTTLNSVKPLRYCAMFDSHPESEPYVARFHAKKVLKFQDALLTSYHRNEVKFAELTLDTFRMLQCLEWEPSGSFYQKHPVEPKQNVTTIDYSAASGLIDINMAADMTDPTLPPNPKKVVVYRPSVTHLIAVIATICEELPPESVVLIYLSASGKAGYSSASQTDSSGGSRKSSKTNVASHTSDKDSMPEFHLNGKGDYGGCSENYLWLGPRGNGGSSKLFPDDIIPFTRKPLFLIIDSDNSHAFKAVHGAERGETAALFLSPLRPAFKNLSGVDILHGGSQFTFFLTAPLQAFCQLVGLSFSTTGVESDNGADDILFNAFSEWEKILCTSTDLHLAWAQVLSDPLLRRLILRFIFCRAALTLFSHHEEKDQYLPICVPHLPDSVAPTSKSVEATIARLANHLKVTECFEFNST